MSKPLSFEHVKKLVQRLSPTDRMNLLQHIANLPDSRIKAKFELTEVPESPPILPSQKTQDILMLKEYMWIFEVNTESGEISYKLDGREVFRAKFNMHNYAEACFQKLKENALTFTVTDVGRARLRQKFQAYVDKYGGTMPSEEQLETIEKDVLQDHSHNLLRQNLLQLAQNIDQNLSEVVTRVFARIVQTSGFAVANQLRDTIGMPEDKISTADIRNVVYRAEWQGLKTIVGLRTQGGAHNVKHPWTDKDRQCLSETYEQLKPIWLDAKQIARETQQSRIKNRKSEWRNEVLRSYPDLPLDLLEEFSSPRGGAKPSDNAIIHASRKCGITPGISARHLRDIVRAWNLKHKPRTSTGKAKPRKLKSPA